MLWSLKHRHYMGKKIDSHGNEIQYCYCNRSGHYTSKSKGHRKTKTWGTYKLNRYCTKTSTDTITGAVETERSMLYTLWTQNVLAISGQLHQGILDNVRESVGDDLRHVHLVTRKDIRNIKIHTDDATSVALWVHEMMEKAPHNQTTVTI